MEIKKAIEIVTLLADGIDPHTGEVFPHDSPYQAPDTVRSLYLAVKGLEQLEKSERRQKRLPENAGKGWEEQEEKLLADGFDNGKTINELAEIHQRTVGSIRSRLVKLRKIEEK
ncbi:hypothetical protein QA612_15475 [Evansella sp. AB-P1]|uniref:hypothetical protein n=1 Tax=Evansella sp. AB-P1 TaxID=3037653 RepID=UPI00241FD68A|nr:hypothetical protein [Evansella sp. AB-P1]MDG5788871.1 hypothetical protein [Evansella sp. AB-P1]